MKQDEERQRQRRTRAERRSRSHLPLKHTASGLSQKSSSPLSRLHDPTGGSWWSSRRRVASGLLCVILQPPAFCLFLMDCACIAVERLSPYMDTQTHRNFEA